MREIKHIIPWLSGMATVLAIGLAASAAPAPAARKVTYQDDLLPVLRNTCLNCHNPDKKKAGLDLSTYQGLLAGSDDGKVINSGDPDGSLLYKTVSHKEEPFMPKNADKLSDKEIAVFRDWIAGGALETNGSSAIASDKPKANLTLAATSLGKPAGPIAMPAGLPLDPVMHSPRSGPLLALAASPWAPVVALGGQRQVILYQSQTLDLLGVMPFPDGLPAVLKFSRNGSLLLVGGGEGAKLGKVGLYDVANGHRLGAVGNEFDTVLAADLMPDQSAVALGGPAKVLKAYSTKDNQLLYAVKKHTDWVTAISFSPDGVLLASGDRSGNLYVWESRTGREFYTLAGHKDGITELAFRADSNVLASASQDGTIKLWNMHDGNLIKSISAHGSGVLSLAFAHDGRMASCGRDNVVRTWTADGNNDKTFDAFGDIALHVAFAFDDSRVIAGDWTGQVKVWTAADAKLAGELTANPLPVAERIGVIEKQVAELQSAAGKASAEAAAAQDVFNKAVADEQAGKNAAADGAKNVQAATAALQAAKAAATAAPAAVQKLRQDLQNKQNDAQRLGQAKRQAVAARDEAVAKQTALAARVAAAQKSVDAAKSAADTAAADAKKKPEDKALATKADQLKASLGRLMPQLADAQKALAAQTEPMKNATDAVTKASTAVDQANAAVTALQRTVTAQVQVMDKAAAAVPAAQAALAKATADTEAATKAIPAKSLQVKAAADRLAAAKGVAEAAMQKVTGAKAQLARLKSTPVAAATQPDGKRHAELAGSQTNPASPTANK